jgi:hypothetical protein
VVCRLFLPGRGAMVPGLKSPSDTKSGKPALEWDENFMLDLSGLFCLVEM